MFSVRSARKSSCDAVGLVCEAGRDLLRRCALTAVVEAELIALCVLWAVIRVRHSLRF